MPATRGSSFQTNGSKAKSQGVEANLDARPVRGMSLRTWFSYNDAKLTAPVPPGSFIAGGPGDRLPLASRYSGGASLDQSFPLSAAVEGSVGASVSYVGKRAATLSSAPRILPEYTKVDLQAGLTYDRDWSVSLYVNNLTDKRGLLNFDLLSPTSIYYIQPRTIGLSLAKTF